MKKVLPFVFLFVFTLVSKAQQGIEIGQINNGVYEFTVHELSVAKAIEWTLRDGSKVSELKIEQLNNVYFLVAVCNYQTYKRTIAVDLDQVGTKFVLTEDAFIKICSAVACQTCKFFFENRKIIACKCEETGTISNHCHYRSAPATAFAQNLQRAIKLQRNEN